MEQCDLVRLKDVDTAHLQNYDLIGIGSPVWGAVPRNVENFVNALSNVLGKYVFAFSTHGARGGRFFPIMVKLLKKKGLKIIGIRDWYGSVNLPMHPKPYLTDGHPDMIDLEEAMLFGKEMAELFLRARTEGPQAIPKLPKMPLPPATRLIRPRPKYDSKKCRYPECTLCVDHCPVNGIDLSATPPVFGKNCLTCHFCEMICPEGAIYVDYDAFAKKSKRRGKSIYTKTLKEAETQGHFRRLVPIEDIDWNTPYYKKFNQHPRYIISDEADIETEPI